MANRSAFPTTHATWLETLLVERDPRADGRMSDTDGVHAHSSAGLNAASSAADRAQTARRHVMERYAGPLEVFVKGSSLARLGEPKEIVNGFFAARLSDEKYLRAWPASGMRFRRWLMNGMLFYGQGLARDAARAAARGTTVAAEELDRRIGAGSAAEADFERAWALAVVREATARVESELLDEGRAVEFEIFRRHAILGQPYAEFAQEVDRTPQQCAHALRNQARARGTRGSFARRRRARIGARRRDRTRARGFVRGFVRGDVRGDLRKDVCVDERTTDADRIKCNGSEHDSIRCLAAPTLLRGEGHPPHPRVRLGRSPGL